MNHLRLLRYILLLCFLTQLFNCRFQTENFNMNQGLMDLTKMDANNLPLLKIKGEAEFYWRQLPREKDLENRPGPPEYQLLGRSWHTFLRNGQPLGPNGFAAYRFRIKLDKIPEQPLAFKIGEQATAFRLFINDRELASGGRIGETANTSLPERRMILIPFRAPAREFSVILHYSNFHSATGGNWTPLILGNNEQVFALYEQYLSLDLLLFGSILVIGLYHIILFMLRRQNPATLYFGGFCFFIALFSISVGNLYFSELFPGVSWVLSHRLLFLSFHISPALFLLFIYSLYPEEFLPYSLGIILGIIAVFLFPVVFLSSTAYGPFMEYFLGFLLLLEVYTFFILIRSIYRGRKHALILLVGFSIFLVSVSIDILRTLNNFSSQFHTHLGFLGLIFSQAFFLTRRFAEASKKVETLSSKLRTKNRQLDALNQSLEVKVQKRTSSLLETQKLADRDMNMAIHVQQNLLANVPHLLDGWDVALHFQPVAGISGDSYDFYLIGSRLKGLSLLDVSGHGIASGLVAMIARTVIQRCFRMYRKLPLNAVLERSNRELMEEIGHVDNYLTGIIMRLKGARVDYVCAGHSPPLLYRAASRKVENPGDSEGFRPGMVLGMKEMRGKYEVHSFSMESEDCILLFSDALVESKNKQALEFGHKRLNAAFSSIKKDATAQEILNDVLMQFHEFLGKEPKRDDLTVIVLRKR